MKYVADKIFITYTISFKNSIKHIIFNYLVL